MNGKEFGSDLEFPAQSHLYSAQGYNDLVRIARKRGISCDVSPISGDMTTKRERS